VKFVDRESELAFLNKEWKSKEARFVIVYGKRRVGKTELILQFMKDRPHLYFLADKIPDNLQVKKFSQSVGNFFNDDVLARRGFENWEDTLRYIAEKKRRFVLTIDEFPYLVESNPAISSIFQKAWDLSLKNSPIFLVLMGSSISMMERETLAYRAPLYGRRTGQLMVKPFRFIDFGEAFPNIAFEERLTIYSLVGGTPAYLLPFWERKGIWKAVEQEILTKGKALYEEVEFLLREELVEPRNYFAILRAMSLGKTKFGEIMNECGFDKGTTSRYLSILNRLQITRKEVPVTEKFPEKSRKGMYLIEDNFFSFWFRFVFRNRDRLEMADTVSVVSEIKQAQPSMLAENYERVIREISKESFTIGVLPPFERYGRWWDKGEEIDLVATNGESNRILFGEAKWSQRPVGTDIYEDLKRKARLVEWGKPERKEYYCLFSRSGFTPKIIEAAKREGVFLFQEDRLVSR
jgi:AAA+ ATPase superfamily predicted ATPase